jgi:hypothetical protein
MSNCVDHIYDQSKTAQLAISDAALKIVADKDFIPEPVLQEFVAILDAYDVKQTEVSVDVKARLQAEMSRIEQTLSTCRTVVYTFGVFIQMQSLIIAFGFHQQAINGGNLIFSLVSAGFIYAFICSLEEKQKLIQSILARIA